jgi:transcriptional regulator with XRE-family HTH domain
MRCYDFAAANLWRMALPQHLRTRLKARRQELGLSQSQLAERVGMTKQQISVLERGKSDTTTQRLYDLAAALDLDVLIEMPERGAVSLSDEDRGLIDRIGSALPELSDHDRAVLINVVEGVLAAAERAAAAG